jgi:branched-chain amino acid transport system permease protein
MVVLGGLGSIWGAVVGGITIATLNDYVLPHVLNGLPGAVGLDFDLSEVSSGIFGFLLVTIMLLRPGGLVPERRPGR